MILMRRIDKVFEKIEEIKKMGLENLAIVADFDKTLSKPNLENPKASSVIGTLRAYNYLGDDYTKKAYELFDKYHPFEIDENLSFEEKSKKMDEWWQTHIKVMAEHGLNREIVEDIVNTDKVKLRDNIEEFISFLRANNIPLLIFSAGIGDVIKEILVKKNLYYDELRIISNFYDYDSNGKVLGYKNKVIVHSLNKGELALTEQHYLEKVAIKQNVLLLGDSLNDLHMVVKEKHKNILTVGFYNNSDDNKLQSFLEKYDIVIKDLKSIKEVNDLLSLFK